MKIVHRLLAIVTGEIPTAVVATLKEFGPSKSVRSARKAAGMRSARKRPLEKPAVRAGAVVRLRGVATGACVGTANVGPGIYLGELACATLLDLLRFRGPRLYFTLALRLELSCQRSVLPSAGTSHCRIQVPDCHFQAGLIAGGSASAFIADAAGLLNEGLRAQQLPFRVLRIR